MTLGGLMGGDGGESVLTVESDKDIYNNFLRNGNEKLCGKVFFFYYLIKNST